MADKETDDFKKMMDNADRIVHSQNEFNRVQELINNPPNPSPALRELMTRELKFKTE